MQYDGKNAGTRRSRHNRVRPWRRREAPWSAHGQSPPFIFDAGDLALDLLNTRPIAQGAPVDFLRTADDLDAWLAAAGLRHPGPAAELPRARHRILAEALALRDAIGVAVIAYTRGRAPDPRSIAAINRVLATRRLERRLEYRGATPVRRGFWTPAAPAAVLAPVAEAALQLLTEARRDRIRQCDHEACVLWYLDATRNGRRRWCSMERCGSRAKSTAYYYRHHGAASAG